MLAYSFDLCWVICNSQGANISLKWSGLYYQIYRIFWFIILDLQDTFWSFAIRSFKWIYFSWDLGSALVQELPCLPSTMTYVGKRKGVSWLSLISQQLSMLSIIIFFWGRFYSSFCSYVDGWLQTVMLQDERQVGTGPLGFFMLPSSILGDIATKTKTPIVYRAAFLTYTCVSVTINHL